MALGRFYLKTRSHISSMQKKNIISNKTYLFRAKYILGRKFVRFLYEMTVATTVPFDITSVRALVIPISI